MAADKDERVLFAYLWRQKVESPHQADRILARMDGTDAQDVWPVDAEPGHYLLNPLRTGRLEDRVVQARRDYGDLAGVGAVVIDQAVPTGKPSSSSSLD
ncbi:MAG TPA: hypothetical protein VGR06_43415 [Actinophytocola sp.]|uniref:hypothetical protein n=1 Tax=Actinophytocola sp. TaxID=1872138 RepID=UPI002E05965B|nr:hypothetical protein [Actinophytocola sp.]